MVVGALRVVTTNNVVHAALWLVVVLAGAAAQYLLLAAEFVAVTQILVYVGAVMVLFLFGTMLDPGPDRPGARPQQQELAAGARRRARARRHARLRADRRLRRRRAAREDPAIQSVQNVSDSIFGPYLIPFWALSFVLLAAVVGAIVLARKD